MMPRPAFPPVDRAGGKAGAVFSDPAAFSERAIAMNARFAVVRAIRHLR